MLATGVLSDVGLCGAVEWHGGLLAAGGRGGGGRGGGRCGGGRGGGGRLTLVWVCQHSHFLLGHSPVEQGPFSNPKNARNTCVLEKNILDRNHPDLFTLSSSY